MLLFQTPTFINMDSEVLAVRAAQKAEGSITTGGALTAGGQAGYYDLGYYSDIKAIIEVGW